jgi:hypothetical protein
MKYLKIFELLADYEAYKSSSEYMTPNVSYIESEGVYYEPYVAYTPVTLDNYLTIEALEDGLTAKLSTNACEYCVDGDGNWKSLAANTATETINAGQTLSFRAELTPDSSKGIGTFTIIKKCNLKGNCMSMLFGDNAADNYSVEGKNYAFYKLFAACKNIINVSNNFLPATTLATYCYNNMFSSCTNLTTAPELPATELASECYCDMFSGCSYLTSAPALPATTLKDYCYSRMFQGCFSLTTAPELPATTLATHCYSYMFQYCTGLTTAPALPATTLANGCYNNMFNRCYALTTIPELPATTLKDYCYYNMFSGCKNLNYIKMLATDVSAREALCDWVSGVAPTGAFVKSDGAELPTGTSGIPEGWTVVNEGDSNGDSNINLSDLFGDYTESFNDSSYYGYPAKGTLTIAESDNSGYVLKMTFFGGKPCTVTTYGKLLNNGTQIITAQTSCNMGKFYPSTFNISIDGNNVTISGQPKFDYPTTVPDYVATKN